MTSAGLRFGWYSVELHPYSGGVQAITNKDTGFVTNVKQGVLMMASFHNVGVT